MEAHEFLEWAEFGGNQYGTLKSEVVERLVDGRVILNEIELQGIEILKDIIPPAHRTIIYIEAGDWETLKARAQSRAPISDEELARRYERYQVEVAAKPYADIVIENGEGQLEDAQAAVATIVNGIITHTQPTT